MLQFNKVTKGISNHDTKFGFEITPNWCFDVIIVFAISNQNTKYYTKNDIIYYLIFLVLIIFIFLLFCN